MFVSDFSQKEHLYRMHVCIIDGSARIYCLPPYTADGIRIQVCRVAPT